MDKIGNIFAGIMCAFLLWVAVSWVDVIADNLQPKPRHSEYNFFVVMTTFWEDELY